MNVEVHTTTWGSLAEMVASGVLRPVTRTYWWGREQECRWAQLVEEGATGIETAKLYRDGRGRLWLLDGYQRIEATRRMAHGLASCRPERDPLSAPALAVVISGVDPRTVIGVVTSSAMLRSKHSSSFLFWLNRLVDERIDRLYRAYVEPMIEMGVEKPETEGLYAALAHCFASGRCAPSTHLLSNPTTWAWRNAAQLASFAESETVSESGYVVDMYVRARKMLRNSFAAMVYVALSIMGKPPNPQTTQQLKNRKHAYRELRRAWLEAGGWRGEPSGEKEGSADKARFYRI